MRRLLASLILLAAAAAPADACINDGDTDKSEREFQKRYDTEVVAESEPFAPPYAATAGVLLLLAGAGIVRKRIRD